MEASSSSPSLDDERHKSLQLHVIFRHRRFCFHDLHTWERETWERNNLADLASTVAVEKKIRRRAPWLLPHHAYLAAAAELVMHLRGEVAHQHGSSRGWCREACHIQLTTPSLLYLSSPSPRRRDPRWSRRSSPSKIVGLHRPAPDPVSLVDLVQEQQAAREEIEGPGGVGDGDWNMKIDG